jgi:DNA repair protein RecO (recombination protein O)
LSGEHSDIWLLSAEEGIIRATVFGGPKSRLRAYVSPFHSGQIWIYHNPIKDSRKISDFDVHSWRPGLRELYERAITADAAAQTILDTHGSGGNWAEALTLAEEVLDALESSNEELCSRILVYFFWKWAAFLGVRPQLENCSSCGKTVNGPLWYSSREGEVFCENCSSVQDPGLLLLGSGCQRWLNAVENLPPSRLGSCSMDNKSMAQTKEFTLSIISGVLGKRPMKWD